MIPTRYPSNGSKYSIVAGYGNFRYDLSDKTTLAFGTRYTHTSLSASWNETALIDSQLNAVDVKNTAMTGSFSIAYRPTKSWRINILASSGFRSPNIDDLGKLEKIKDCFLCLIPV